MPPRYARVPILAALLALTLPLAGCQFLKSQDGTPPPLAVRAHMEAEGKASATIDVATYGLPTRVLTAKADAGGTVDVDTARTPAVIATGSWTVVSDENEGSAPGAIEVRSNLPQSSRLCGEGACAPPSTRAGVTDDAVARCGPLPLNAKPGEVWCCTPIAVPAAPAYLVELAPERSEWQRVDCPNAGDADCWALVVIPAVREMRVPAAPPPVYAWRLTDCGPAPRAAAPEPCAPRVAAPPPCEPEAPAPAARAPQAPLPSLSFPNPFACDESRRGKPVYRNCKGEPPTQVNNPSTSPHLPEPGTGWPCPQAKVGAAQDPCPRGLAAIVGGLIDLVTFRWLGGL